MSMGRGGSASSGRALLGAAVALIAWASPVRAQSWFFDNFNGGLVMNKPTKATVITLTAATTITQLITYHWNNGMGKAPGSIGLRGRGKLYGPYPAVGEVGQGGVPNAAWDTLGLSVTLPAGKYVVVDTDVTTWAQNQQSNGQGFTRVAAMGPTAACMAPASKKGVPYGGDCRGAGCEHPDLTAYGGNGPAGSATTDRHIHGSVPASVKFVSWTCLTDAATLSQQCTQRGGTQLVLVDDEPWYYYFSGWCPRFYCT